MIDGTGALLEPLVAWLVVYLIHSAVLICAVWLGVRLRIVRTARTQDFLWKLALLGGIATSVGATLHASVPRSGEALGGLDVRVRVMHEEEAVRWTRVPPGLAGGAALPRPSGPTAACRRALDGAMQAAGPTVAEPPRELAVLASACLGPGHGRARAMVIVWLAVGVLALGMDVRRRRLLRRVLRDDRPAGSRARRALDRVVPHPGPRPQLRVSNLVASPCVHRSAIVLPARCELELSDAELEAVLAHEWGHVSRRDGIWTAIADVVVSVLWVQPLNRVTRSGLRGAAELVCDDWAVHRTGGRVDLARSIWRVAMWSRGDGRPLPASSLARWGAHGLSERVRRILGRDEGRGGRGRGRGWGAALLLCIPLALLPVRSPRRAHGVVLAREAVVTTRAPGVARSDSLRVEVRAVRLR